jgi:hypothetical protein
MKKLYPPKTQPPTFWAFIGAIYIILLVVSVWVMTL